MERTSVTNAARQDSDASGTISEGTEKNKKRRENKKKKKSKWQDKFAIGTYRPADE